MAQIEKIKPGDILYDKHKYKMGRSTMTRYGVWQVYVKDVDPEGRFIYASWNGNMPRKMYEKEVSKLRVKMPKID